MGMRQRGDPWPGVGRFGDNIGHDWGPPSNIFLNFIDRTNWNCSQLGTVETGARVTNRSSHAMFPFGLTDLQMTARYK